MFPQLQLYITKHLAPLEKNKNNLTAEQKILHGLLEIILHLLKRSNSNYNAEDILDIITFIERLPVDTTTQLKLFGQHLAENNYPTLLNPTHTHRPITINQPITCAMRKILGSIQTYLMRSIWRYSFPCNQNGEIMSDAIRVWQRKNRELSPESPRKSFIDYTRNFTICGELSHGASDEIVAAKIKRLISQSRAYAANDVEKLTAWLSCRGGQEIYRFVELTVMEGIFTGDQLDKYNLVLLSKSHEQKISLAELQEISKKNRYQPILINQCLENKNREISIYGYADQEWKLTKLDNTVFNHLSFPPAGTTCVLPSDAVSEAMHAEITAKRGHIEYTGPTIGISTHDEQDWDVDAESGKLRFNYAVSIRSLQYASISCLLRNIDGDVESIDLTDIETKLAPYKQQKQLLPPLLFIKTKIELDVVDGVVTPKVVSFVVTSTTKTLRSPAELLTTKAKVKPSVLSATQYANGSFFSGIFSFSQENSTKTSTVSSNRTLSS